MSNDSVEAIFIGVPITIALIAIIIAVVVATRRSHYKSNTVTEYTVSDNAVVMQKRTDMEYSAMSESHYLVNYVTFNTENYGRIELRVPNNRIGLLREGDRGELVFENRKKRGFKRFDLI
jgi:hypothetical protein